MLRIVLVGALLLTTACRDETISGQAGPSEVFTLTEIDGAPVKGDATLSFPQKGQIAGKGPCNRFSAQQTAPLPWVEIGPIAATRMACPELALEARYFDRLRAMTEIERVGPVLLLSNETGQSLTFRLTE